MSLINLRSKKRLRVSDLRTRVEFYEYKPVNGPLPEEKEHKKIFSCWAKVDELWLKDLELAKQNGTTSDVTIIIRDPMDSYVPTNKHYLTIIDPMYKDIRYNIKHVQPDVQDRSFINIVAEVST